jgi:hypothetical protein
MTKNPYKVLVAQRFEKELSKWVECGFDSVKMGKFLSKNGWRDINKKGNGVFKRVFVKDEFVLKFDMDKWENHMKSHTFSEYRSWLSSSKKRRSYICTPYLYFKGVLIQPRLENVCDRMEEVPLEIQAIAEKFGFSHYWNYGYLKGKVKFFDTDSLYYELTDPEERVNL